MARGQDAQQVVGTGLAAQQRYQPRSASWAARFSTRASRAHKCASWCAECFRLSAWGGPAQWLTGASLMATSLDPSSISTAVFAAPGKPGGAGHGSKPSAARTTRNWATGLALGSPASTCAQRWHRHSGSHNSKINASFWVPHRRHAPATEH